MMEKLKVWQHLVFTFYVELKNKGQQNYLSDEHDICTVVAFFFF